MFVRSGAIVPLVLGDDVQTLCDTNYVNNAAIRTWDGGLEIRVYPAGASQFTIFDGTDIQCNQVAASVTVTVGSADRAAISPASPRSQAGGCRSRRRGARRGTRPGRVRGGNRGLAFR